MAEWTDIMQDKPTQLNSEQITKANLDLAERLFNEGVRLVYDEDGDTLFLNIGESQPQINVHITEGIYFCVHPDTLKIVGITILSFASDLLANNKLIRKAFPDALAVLKKNDGVIEWNGPDAQKIKPVFDLVMTR